MLNCDRIVIKNIFFMNKIISDKMENKKIFMENINIKEILGYFKSKKFDKFIDTSPNKPLLIYPPL